MITVTIGMPLYEAWRTADNHNRKILVEAFQDYFRGGVDHGRRHVGHRDER